MGGGGYSPTAPPPLATLLGVGVSSSTEIAVSGLLLAWIIWSLELFPVKKNSMTMSNIIRSRKVTRIIPLNSEEVAWPQLRISEFLSDNANKDNTRPCGPSSPDAEKTSNLSSQVEKVLLLKESVSKAKGTAKMV